MPELLYSELYELSAWFIHQYKTNPHFTYLAYDRYDGDLDFDTNVYISEPSEITLNKKK